MVIRTRAVIQSKGTTLREDVKIPHQFSSFNCTFYQFLRVQHSCYSTQSWGSVQPSIVEARDQSSRGCPLLFLNRNLGFFCIVDKKSYTPTAFGKLWTTPGLKTCLIIIHDPSMRPGPESNRGPLELQMSALPLS